LTTRVALYLFFFSKTVANDNSFQPPASQRHPPSLRFLYLSRVIATSPFLEFNFKQSVDPRWHSLSQTTRHKHPALRSRWDHGVDARRKI